MKNPFLKQLPLAVKLSMMISLLVIAGVSILSTITLNKQHTIQSQQINDFSIAMAKQLASAMREPLFTDDSLSMQLMINNFAQLPRVVAAAAVDNQQQLLAQSEGSSISRETIAYFTQTIELSLNSISQAQDNGIVHAASPIEFNNKTGGYVVIALETHMLSSIYQHTLKLLLWVSGGIILLGLLAAYFISQHISNPIKQIINAAQRMSHGSLERIEERRNDELGQLIGTINKMSDGLIRKQQVESLLDRFLAKDVASQLLQQLDTVEVKGERVDATVLFADIVGFTSLSEQLSPEKVAELLNEYFSYFTLCANMYFGSIDKFIGDCAMVVFGAPKKNAQHQFHAIACAILMQKLTAALNQRRRRQQLPEIKLSIGINSGPMLAGVLGNQKRMEYTVVGDSVNLASRLCSEAGSGEILTTYAACQQALESNKISASKYKALRVRGKEKQVKTYLINDIAREYQLSMDSLIEDILSQSTHHSEH
ncbi:HAMP domain-containing protein [Dasania sp. GY-MA-18]|uniref:HAMP domain-containing protein n=1 Tax=Dasania phycosphaerae TaxID=2950436 RepID=A0A9J6RIY2_9GAMM|nr:MULTISPECIES: adenylate/guanylate cyclase domain-containing protein [Dasania]MCR8921505.1 HAMP domain-containing protein [Dasania sp. GY-MA-18]MCZ0863933.1 HAMP domain-containing protein [Dasania phycosphaerae]MCZ0867661.1 HAMP domain-containing protein [Dasania phycosphaerae]